MPQEKVNQREVRTQIIIDYFTGLPGEFYMLKALLCARSPFEIGSYSYDLFNSAYDSGMIAKRMDAVRMANTAKLTEKAAKL